VDVKLTLSVLPDAFAICRLDPEAAIPGWATADRFFSITRTHDELSIVCLQRDVPAGIRCEPGWRCLKVEGPLALSLIGIMASLSSTLAQAGISLFALSTYDTDYLLVKEDKLERAIRALAEAGHRIEKHTG
jgi:hypothetical protein